MRIIRVTSLLIMLLAIPLGAPVAQQGSANRENHRSGDRINGAQPAGFRLGIAATVYSGEELVAGDGINIAPSASLIYLTPTGLGFDLSASLLREGRSDYTWGSGVAGTVGMIYNIAGTVLMPKAGISVFWGRAGEGDETGGIGLYVGLGTILRAGDHLGFRIDVLLHHYWGTHVDFPGERMTAVSFSAGIAILPKP